MNIMTEELQKRKTKLRTRMDYKNVKPQQKDDYENVKKFFLEEKYFWDLHTWLTIQQITSSFSGNLENK